MPKSPVVPRIKALLSDHGLSLFMIASGLFTGVSGAVIFLQGNQFEQAMTVFFLAGFVVFLGLAPAVWQHENAERAEAAKKVRQGLGELTPQEVRAELEAVLKKARQSRRKIEAEEAKIEARLAQLGRIELSV